MPEKSFYTRRVSDHGSSSDATDNRTERATTNEAAQRFDVQRHHNSRDTLETHRHEMRTSLREEHRQEIIEMNARHEIERAEADNPRDRGLLRNQHRERQEVFTRHREARERLEEELRTPPPSYDGNRHSSSYDGNERPPAYDGNERPSAY